MSEIELIKLATEKRKRLKKKADSFFSLSAKSESKLANFGTFPILTEGIVVDGKGKPNFGIAKNTLQRMHDSMPEDFEGLIKLSHQPYADMPVFLGKFTKEDLAVIDYKEGRKQLTCDIKLMSDSPLVQQLMLQDNPVGFSIEGYFNYEGDEALLSEYDFDVYDTLNLLNLSIVGQSADVMVGDVEDFKPKGENKNMGIIAEMKKMFDSVDNSKDEEKKSTEITLEEELEKEKAKVTELEGKLSEKESENEELKKEVKMAEELLTENKEYFEGLKKLSNKDVDVTKKETKGKLFTGNAFK